jgi:hypothetical protein
MPVLGLDPPPAIPLTCRGQRSIAPGAKAGTRAGEESWCHVEARPERVRKSQAQRANSRRVPFAWLAEWRLSDAPSPAAGRTARATLLVRYRNRYLEPAEPHGGHNFRRLHYTTLPLPLPAFFLWQNRLGAIPAIVDGVCEQAAVVPGERVQAAVTRSSVLVTGGRSRCDTSTTRARFANWSTSASATARLEASRLASHSSNR